MKQYKVYKITNNLTQEIYIGYTSKSLQIRFYQHSNSAKLIGRKIREYGVENFDIALLESYDDKKLALSREIYFIEHLNSIYPNGYNITKGGNPGRQENLEKLKERLYLLKKFSKNSENQIKLLEGIIEDKESSFVVVSIKTKEIIFFKDKKTFTDAGFSYNKYMNGEYFVLKNERVNMDYDYYRNRYKKIHKMFPEEFSIGKVSWLNCDRESRIKKIQTGNAKTKKSMLGVNVINGEVLRFDGANDARRAGFSVSSIYSSLNKDVKTGQGYVWFYDEGQDDEYFRQEALKIIGSFKEKFNKSLIGTNIKTKEEVEFENITDASLKCGIKVKVISRHLKGDKGYANYVKGWKFRFK